MVVFTLCVCEREMGGLGWVGCRYMHSQQNERTYVRTNLWMMDSTIIMNQPCVHSINQSITHAHTSMSHTIFGGVGTVGGCQTTNVYGVKSRCQRKTRGTNNNTETSAKESWWWRERCCCGTECRVNEQRIPVYVHVVAFWYD